MIFGREIIKKISKSKLMQLSNSYLMIELKKEHNLLKKVETK